MKTIKVKDVLPAFEKFVNKFDVKRIKDKMLLVCEEPMAFACVFKKGEHYKSRKTMTNF